MRSVRSLAKGIGIMPARAGTEFPPRPSTSWASLVGSSAAFDKLLFISDFAQRCQARVVPPSDGSKSPRTGGIGRLITAPAECRLPAAVFILRKSAVNAGPGCHCEERLCDAGNRNRTYCGSDCRVAKRLLAMTVRGDAQFIQGGLAAGRCATRNDKGRMASAHPVAE
jgi:hypothetical protein